MLIALKIFLLAWLVLFTETDIVRLIVSTILSSTVYQDRASILISTLHAYWQLICLCELMLP